MNKNFKVITINGIRGILVAVFLVLGLIAGFIISPGWVCMKAWNYFFENSSVVSLMNLYQGIMFWAIIVLSLYALNNKRALIGFGSYQGLSSEQIKDIMQRTHDEDLQKLNMLQNIQKNLSIKAEEDKNNNTEQNIENKESDTEKAGK